MELRRCVQAAVATLDSRDLLVVLDDSSPEQSRSSQSWLADIALTSPARICHVGAQRAHIEVSRSLGNGDLEWQRKTSARDISPLRNLSLLFSASIQPTTTVLIDDDISAFRLDCTHQICDDLEAAPDGLIAGAAIGNLTDLDTLTKLSAAVRYVTKAGIADPTADIFRGSSGDADEVSFEACMSAGYMAFRLPTSRLFAFPPGYNEDWLWCLLQRGMGKIRIVRMEQEVRHDPFLLRAPTRDGIHFETLGDVVFDCLSECSGYGRWLLPELALKALQEFTPDKSSLPATRAAALVEQLLDLTPEQRARALGSLSDRGLVLFQKMLDAGELEIGDGRSLLCSWSHDALIKHLSFGATIANPRVISRVRQILEMEEK